MADRTLVLVDAGMAAGFRLAKPSLGQLHQALVHLHRQHPDAQVAVLADPALKWDLATAEGPMFEGDIVAGAIVCAPAGALDGTAGFLARAAAKALAQWATRWWPSPTAPSPTSRSGGSATTPGRWLWDLDATRTLDADQIGPALPSSRRRRRSSLSACARRLVRGPRPRAGGRRSPRRSRRRTRRAPAPPPGRAGARTSSRSRTPARAPSEAGDRGGALQLGLLALVVVAIGGAVLVPRPPVAAQPAGLA